MQLNLNVGLGQMTWMHKEFMSKHTEQAQRQEVKLRSRCREVRKLKYWVGGGIVD